MLNGLRRSPDDGFTLIELLLATSLVMAVSVVSLTGLVQSMRTTSEAESRMEALNEIQVAMERVARELRAADPVLAGFSSDSVSVQVFRTGGTACTQYTVRLSGGQLLMDRQDSTDSCATLGALSTQILVRDVAGGSGPAVFGTFVPGSQVFSYTTEAGQLPVDPAEIAAIRFTLTRSIPDQTDVTVSTVVNIRNTR